MTKQHFSFLLAALFFSLTAFTQATFTFTDTDKKFKEAKDLYLRQQYSLAYPLLNELERDYTQNQKANFTNIKDEVDFYYLSCKLHLKFDGADLEAKNYIEWVQSVPLQQMMGYQLGKYYFTKENYSDAIKYFEQAGLENLANEQIADAKFEKAYCYFYLNRFNEAKPLFNEIHQLPDHKYYIPANYYYGFICYGEKNFVEALTAFRLVESKEEYKGVVPYYITEIYYFQNKKEEALRYGESVLNRGNVYYERDLKLLMGQIYFEKKNFAKALPLLEYYVNNSEKVSRENLYELSYCYYEAGKINKAIEGLKQLSNEKDSLGQNSMYLLGDCYLKTNQKANARSAFQYCAFNNSNLKQQEISRFNYAKLSYELGYQDIALNEMKKFLSGYPASVYQMEGKEILVGLLANTNNFTDALALYESFSRPTATMQKVYPGILYGKAVEHLNDQQVAAAEVLFTKIIQLPASSVTPYANFWKGEINYRLLKYDDAIRYFSAFLQSSVPALGEANYSTAKYNIGYSWLKKENYKLALASFEPISLCTPVATALQQDAYVRTADCYFMGKDFVKAKTMYDKVINNALPQSDYAMFQNALIAGIKSSANKIATLNLLNRNYPASNLVADANMEIANTYMADEKFADAILYLNKVLLAKNSEGLKPVTYLKMGLSNYNLNKNAEALNNYKELLRLYPKSAEADEAMDNMKNIYVEEGKPNEYVALMKQYGKNISITEADSLTFSAALLKYNANDCNAAISGFKNYLTAFPSGAFWIEANFNNAECYYKIKDWPNALAGYTNVVSKSLNKYFERAALTAARINYFELKDYAQAKTFFSYVKSVAVNQDNQLEALRGLVRCFYQLKDYKQANEIAIELLTKKGTSTDDKSIAFLVLGKSQQANIDYTSAISSFKSCAAINKSAWGAQARYEIADCYFSLTNYAAAEKAAQATIRETNSYDYWVTKGYMLLGDIFLVKKDYFNAKATYQSVAENSSEPELKTTAQQKLEKAVEEEKLISKLK